MSLQTIAREAHVLEAIMHAVVDMEKKDRDPYHTAFYNLASTWVSVGKRNLAILARVLCPGFFRASSVGDIFEVVTWPR